MKTLATILLCLVCIQLFACSKHGKTVNSFDNIPDTSIAKMTIIVNTEAFSATLYDNAAATAFKALLPLTIEMADLNDNEKYFDLPVNLPHSASNPGTIKTGDLMLYGSNTLVLFYKSFSTSAILFSAAPGRCFVKKAVS